MEEFKLVECINCHKTFDIRDTLYIMNIPYCQVCVAYVLRNRLDEIEKNKFNDILRWKNG